MSYLTIMEFIKDGENSLKNGDYWSALSVALIAPGICSRIKYNNETYRENGSYWSINKKGEKIWQDKKCYIDFCKEIMVCDNHPNSFLTSVLSENFSEILYELRCDIIHAGSCELTAEKQKIYLSVGNDSGNIDLGSYKIVSVKDLCNEIFKHIKVWFSNNHDISNTKHTRIFYEAERDDEILLNRLSEIARSEKLLEEFKKEIKNKESGKK